MIDGLAEASRKDLGEPTASFSARVPMIACAAIMFGMAPSAVARNFGAPVPMEPMMMHRLALQDHPELRLADDPRPALTTVELTNFNFAPRSLQLRANVPTVLQLRNDSSSSHSFSAPAFFAASRLDPQTAKLVDQGRVEVPGHASVELELTPAAGRYTLKCSHAFHATLGMKGEILVR